MKQTALQWFIQQMKYINIIVPKENSDKLLSMMHQAKEMEKEQMKDFFNAGVCYEWGEFEEQYNFEQYYNETFNNK
jgi:hypothetical protein